MQSGHEKERTVQGVTCDGEETVSIGKGRMRVVALQFGRKIETKREVHHPNYKSKWWAQEPNLEVDPWTRTVRLE